MKDIADMVEDMLRGRDLRSGCKNCNNEICENADTICISALKAILRGEKEW